jgi:hypothetical protein
MLFLSKPMVSLARARFAYGFDVIHLLSGRTSRISNELAMANVQTGKTFRRNLVYGERMEEKANGERET